MVMFCLLALARVFNWGKKSRLVWGAFMVGRRGWWPIEVGPFDSPHLR